MPRDDEVAHRLSLSATVRRPAPLQDDVLGSAVRIMAQEKFQKKGLLGGASRDRTDDLIVANDALSQLSYSPTLREVTHSKVIALGGNHILAR